MTANYIVQINMADNGQEAQWTDCEDAKFVAEKDALARIEWMKCEYGNQIEYRVRTLVQDRKTGEFYDPKAKFDELMNKPDIMAMLNRLTIR